MQLTVLRAGLLTTVQDAGRIGHRHLGVGCCGAMDPSQARLANLLLGNDPAAAVLEFTLQGASLGFDSPIKIALTGANAACMFEDMAGSRHPLPSGRPVRLPAGTLHVGALRDGIRAWLALSGGIDVPPVLGSRSTDLRAGFGGHEGRSLRRGDLIRLGEQPPLRVTRPEFPHWWVDAAPDTRSTIRYVPSPNVSTHALASHRWQIHPGSNRQGLRLQGEALRIEAPEQTSAPIAPGSIQLPPDGQPILLLADAQTVGGYLCIGHVIAADLPLLAQQAPGGELSFEAVTQNEAHTTWRRRQGILSRLEWAIIQRLKESTHTT